MKSYGLVMAAVTELVITVLACLFAGRWFDNHRGGGTLFTAAGGIGGFIIAMVRLTSRLKGVMNDNSDSGQGS